MKYVYRVISQSCFTEYYKFSWLSCLLRTCVCLCVCFRRWRQLQIFCNFPIFLVGHFSGSSFLCAYSLPSLCIHSGFGKGFTSLLLVCFLRQGHANARGRIMLECRCLQHRKYVATGYTSATSCPHLLSAPPFTSSTAPCDQHSAMKIDRSWRELSAVFTAFPAIFICATFRRPSAARCASVRLRLPLPASLSCILAVV